MFCKWYICSCFIFTTYTRMLDSFIHLLFVFFRMSNCSCFIAAMFARVLDSFTDWLLVFFKTSLSSCYIAVMFARVFFTHSWASFWCFGIDPFVIASYVQYVQENWTPSCTRYWLLRSFKLSILIHNVCKGKWLLHELLQMIPL